MALLERIGQMAGNLFGSRRGGPPDGNDPKYKEDYVSFVKKEFERRRTERTGLELQWRLNIAFAQGDQFCSINTKTQNIEEDLEMYDWEEREVFNQIAPILEVRHARLTRGRPVRKVRPASGQQADITAAEIASKVIQWTEIEHNHQERLSEIVAWLELTGTCFSKTTWDSDVGRVVALEVGQDGAPQEVREGDIDLRVVPCLEIYPDNLWAGWREQRSIIHARAFPVDEIKEKWGQEVAPEQVDAVTLQPRSVGARGLGYVAGQFGLKASKLEKHALVIEYWERPSKKYPDGRLIIVAGSKALHVGPLPYAVGADGAPDLPFVPYYCHKRPGQFFGDCLVPRLIPVQRRYNSLRNREAEYLKRAAIGQLKIEENSIENIEDVEENATKPGQIFIVKRGYQAPQYMEFPPLPPTFEAEKASLLQEFRSLSGVSDLSKMSDAPAGVKSGIALSIALEQDETRISSVADNIEEGMIAEARLILRLYRQFAVFPRVARIANRSEVEVIEWSASDLRSDDVIIAGGTNLGDSPAQRRQFVFDLLASGLLNDPDTGTLTREGRNALLEAIEYGHWESASDSDYDLQVSAAKRNIAAIKQGMLPYVQPYYDYMVHLQTLHRWMLTQEFEEASQDQRVQFAAYQYREELLRAVQQQVALRAAAGAPMAPMAPAGGGRLMPIGRTPDVIEPERGLNELVAPPEAAAGGGR